MSNTAPISQIAYFGDSLTDSGAFFGLSDLLLTQPLPPALFGYAGQFSDGDVYADIAPDLLDIDVENFAVGGALAVGSLFPLTLVTGSPLFDAFGDPDATQADIDFVAGFDINLGGQIDRFIDSLGGAPAPSGTAASILIGLNDFNAFAPASPVTAVVEAAALGASILGATADAALELLANGVDTVFLNTLFPADFFPIFQFAPDLIQTIGVAAIDEYNAALEGVAATFGPAVQIVDLNAIGTEIQNDPTAFGFLNITDGLFFGTGGNPAIVPGPDGPVPFFAENPALAGLDPDQFAFFDLLHFTTALHGVVGAFSAAAIDGDLSVLTDGGDFARFGRGVDVVLAGLGDDVVLLGRGRDTALGGQGDDVLSGGGGYDILSGGSGDDTLFGQAGNDVLGGGHGNDWLLGGFGKDVLIDGLGSDVAVGGFGADTFLYTEASLIGGTTGGDVDVFRGGLGRDTLVLALTEDTRALVEAELSGGRVERLDSIGVTAIGIEEFVFVDSRLDLANVDVAARLDEADLWGLV